MRIKYMPIRLILLLLSLGVSQSLLAQQIYKANEAGQLLKQANLNSQAAEFKRMSSESAQMSAIFDNIEQRLNALERKRK